MNDDYSLQPEMVRLMNITQKMRSIELSFMWCSHSVHVSMTILLDVPILLPPSLCVSEQIHA